MQHNTSLLEQKKIVQQFNRAASTYAGAAFLQNEIGHRLEERLDDIKLSPATIIDLGCGTGRSIQSLAERFKSAQIVGIDHAANMLVQAKKTNTLKNVQYQCAAASQLPFEDNSVDFIFSNLMFQWCDPLMPALQECYRVLKEGGLLLFSTFGPDTLQELRYCWAQVDNYPHINQFIDMHHIGDMLLKLRFNDPVMDMEYINVAYKEVKNIMRDLQKIGSSNAHPQRRKTLTGKQRLQELEKHYHQFALEDGRLPVTYEVVYGHAWKFKRSEDPLPTEVYISIEDIKYKK